MHVIFPDISYNTALVKAGLTTLLVRRDSFSRKLFSEIVNNSGHKLNHLLPPKSSSCTSRLKTKRTYKLPKTSRNRFKISFIMYYAAKCFK